MKTLKDKIDNFFTGSLVLAVSIGIAVACAEGGSRLAGSKSPLSVLYQKVQERELQKGYALPSKAEIVTRDLDRNNHPETYLQYDGRSYALTVDEEGIPRIREYRVKSARVEPTEIILEGNRK